MTPTPFMQWLRPHSFQRKYRGSYLLYEPVMRYWFMGMVFIALFIPNDILERVSILKVLTDFFSVLFPSIASYSARSDFPQVTAFYMTLSWITSPLHGYYLIKEYRNDLADWTVKFKSPDSWPMRERIKGFIFLLIIPLLLYFMAFMAEGHDFNLIPINSSRIALGFCGWLMSGSGIVAIGTFWYLQAKQLKNLY